ncbi:type II toxin-antitoxin system HicB family antitoxin [Levilactobacillus andaensis]|uniref:type II toxin-antitoxin system HicB family antitoxin n=1 Tax=Levilactobacillus andaensis TaxID=2799570 RepID=UPI00194063AA|nr:hypothetical protein [Levilactobacillus andaensis]
MSESKFTSYPAVFSQVGHPITVVFPDIPELTVSGENYAEAIVNATTSLKRYLEKNRNSNPSSKPSALKNVRDSFPKNLVQLVAVELNN